MPFLVRVFNSSRPDIERLPWDHAQKEAFLRMQFDAQHQYYQQTFPAAEYSVVEWNGAPIGRLYTDRRPDTIHILDITIVPEARRLGIGRSLLQSLIDEASREGKAVSLYVERENAARELYRSLAFEPIGDEGVYTLMRRNPPSK